MDTQSQSLTIQQPRSGSSNAEILGLDPGTFPPTLDDIADTAPTGLPTIHDVVTLTMTSVVGTAWDCGDILSGLRLLHQLDERLPPPSSRDHGVYLVTAPRGHTKYRFIHWSLYSQGHFYHLTAARSDALHYLDAKAEHCSTSSALRRQFPVSLKVQNVLDPEGAHFTPETSATRKTALQAYHIGCTRFTPQQILLLATYVITQIKSYNVFSENCQFFSLCLAYRMVMTRRNCSVFVGHIHQIAAWDQAGGPRREQGFHERATGYVLANPRTEDEIMRRPSIGELMWNDWQSLRRNTHALQIAVLYNKGEEAIRAYNPQGIRTGSRYIWFRPRRRPDNTEEPFKVCKEFVQDVKEGKWREVWYGRLESRKESYIKKEIKARKGSGLTRRLLPLFRVSRGVTEEERRLWATEAAEMLQAETALELSVRDQG